MFSGKAVVHWLQVVCGFPTTSSLEVDDNTPLPMEFVIAEVEYQVDEMLFKMNALAGTANLPEKPPVYFTDSDATFTGGVDEEKMMVLGGGGAIDLGGLSAEGQLAILRMYEVLIRTIQP